MKIAFILEPFPRISQTFVLNQITAMIDFGHEVNIYAEYCSAESQVHSDICKYDLLQRTYYSTDIMLKSRLKRIKKAIRLIIRNFRIHSLVIIRSLNFIKYGKNALNLRCLLYALHFLDKKYDIIHCHFGPNGIFGIKLKEMGIPGKFVTSFHGYDVTRYVAVRGVGVYKKLFRVGDIFTYNSEATKDKLLQMHCPAERMLKLPMGVNLNKFAFKERKIDLSIEIRILSVGRLVEVKGTEYAINAVVKLIKAYPNITYNIVGDGPLKTKLRHLIKDSGLENKIILHGWLVNEKLKGLFDMSQIFLHPSIISSEGCMEGQGVVLSEAMACGIPVVATDHNAIPETIIDGTTGLLVKEKQVDDIVEKVSRLIVDPVIYSKICKNGREFVVAKFNAKKLNLKLAHIYNKLIQGN